MASFYQKSPEFSKSYQQDNCLKGLLNYFVADKNYLKEIDQDLENFSNRIDFEIDHLALESERNPPIHIPYDPWGRRIDEIQTSPAWKRLDEISAEEKLIALGYERKNSIGGHRLHQLAKLYLFHPSSAYYSCPLAMTDGAAKLIEALGDVELKNKAFKNLTSSDPKNFWTSGQWMTERVGGSDVGGSETIAKFIDGEWKLFGTKWFTSATTSQMAMTLARVVDKDGQTIEGSRGLSLFYVELRDEQGRLKNIQVNRLKDKLGTKALPTAELQLKGSPAKLVGDQGRGVAQIATLFNITRIYNTCCSLGAFSRLLNLSKDYASKRIAFSKPLTQHPLHKRTLDELSFQLTGLMSFSFYLVFLLDRDEVLSDGTEREENAKLLRLLTPIGKLFSAKVNLHTTTELIESFGGAGYIEDTGIPKWLRDAQVLTIWEGTTNVLSLDTLRAIHKDGALSIYFKELSDIITESEADGLSQKYLDKCLAEMKKLDQALKKIESAQDHSLWEYHARDLSFSLARVLQGILVFHLSTTQKLEDQHRDHFLMARDYYLDQEWASIRI